MASYPDENSWWNEFRDEVVEVFGLDPSNRTFPNNYDFDLFKWWSRTGFDIGTGMPAHRSKTVHLRELEEALGIGKLPVDGGPPVVGYPDENSWWNDFRDAVVARYRAAGRTFPADFDFDLFKWWSRTGFSIGAGLSPASARYKHLQELRGVLGIPAPPTTFRYILGQLRTQGLAFRDDLGWVKPLLCHFGEAFSAYVRRPDDVRRQLDVIKAAGYQGIRFWDVVGFFDKNRPGDSPWQAWHGKAVTPIGFVAFSGSRVDATPQYYQQLQAFLDELKVRGLVAHHSRGDLNAFQWQQVIEHARRVGEIQRHVGIDVIALNEACNESWQNGVPDPKRLREICDTIGGAALRGTSAADDGYGGELPESFDAFAYDTHIIHGYRGGESHNRIEHIFSVGYDTIPVKHVTAWQSEPTGPGEGVSVAQENNTEALVLMGMMGIGAHQAWNYMSGFGVFWNGPIESQPGFREVPKGIAWLPDDIATWPRMTHGGERFEGTRVLAAVDLESSHQHLRCDHIFRNQEVVIYVYGSPRRWDIPVRKNFDGELYHPATGQTEPISLKAGTTWTVTFDRGRVLKGTTQGAPRQQTLAAD